MKRWEGEVTPRVQVGGYVLGLDLSLSRTGAVLIPTDWNPGDWSALKVFDVTHDVPEKGDWRGQYARYLHFADVLVAWCEPWAIGRAFVESYAYSKFDQSGTKLHELGGVVRVCFLEKLDIVLEPVNESTARKILLGKLPKKGRKKVTEDALVVAGAGFRNGDIADAFVIANFGLTEMGLTALTLA